ncbi:MAG TPA: O-antigen ligase family protein [Blastocatellia bacterium]|jgi:hypothetical protein
MLRTGQPSAFNARFPFFIAALASIALSAALCAAGKYKEAAAASASLLCLAFILTARISIESILITWFVTTPLAYFYIRFPVGKSLITYDRAVFALVVLMLVWNMRRVSRARDSEISDRKSQIRHSGFVASKFEIAWALLSTIALASAVMQSDDLGYATKIAVDSFFLPLVAFHLARHRFDLRGRERLLALGAIMLALFLFITGAFEFATGTNLFQYKGSELIREGELRVNGPFAADTSYTIICLLLALFLQAAPRLLGAQFDRAGRPVYQLALGAAVVATLLPLFRATAIALVVCWIFLRWAGGRRQATGESAITNHESQISNLKYHTRQSLPLRPWPLIAIAMAMAVILFGPFSIRQRITDPRNAFGRLATWEAAASISLEHPFSGVGLTNYREYFHAKYNWEDESVESVMGTQAADSPHSNLLWIAADLGLVALLLYLIANLYLLLMGWRAMKRARGGQQRAAAACYLALLAAYWIPGLTLASGYYSDLNLYFFFMLGLLLKRSSVT